MKYPCLVLERHCKTDLVANFESERISEDGDPIIAVNWAGKCNYQSRAHKVYTDQKVLVSVSGTCLIPGDIAPEIAVISSGTAEVFGEVRRIAAGAKLRNPDGTVNYTRLELE